MGVKHKYEYTEQSIQAGLRSLMPSAEFFLCNMYVFTWESDVLILTKSHYWYEIEIKVSRADFKNDLKHKSKKHMLLSDADSTIKPNYFYYAVPAGLISVEEIPPYAGLIYMHGSRPEIVKPPRKLHSEKMRTDIIGWELASKFYHHMEAAKNQYIRAKREAENLRDPYRKGYKEGITKAMDIALLKARIMCPYHKEIDERSFYCEKQQKEFHYFCHGECGLLDKLQDEMEKSLKIGAYVEQK